MPRRLCAKCATVTNGPSHCPTCHAQRQAALNNSRGTTSERGYGQLHTALRRRYQPLIDAGAGICSMPQCIELTRAIPPGSPWDLNHTPDREGYTGPAHPSCNRSAGAQHRNTLRQNMQTP